VGVERGWRALENFLGIDFFIDLVLFVLAMSFFVFRSEKHLGLLDVSGQGVC